MKYNSKPRTVVPVPDDASEPTFEHIDLGHPSDVYRYTVCDGRTAGYICKFTSLENELTFRPRHYAEKSVGKVSWQWIAPLRGARPLFNLDKISSQTSAILLIHSREDAVISCQEHLPQVLSTCPMMGYEFAESVDWSPIQGRHIVIWPESGSGGKTNAMNVARLCAKAGASSIRIIPLQVSFLEHLDLAMQQRETLSPATIEALIADATEAQFDPNIPNGFRLTETHLEFQQAESDSWSKVCSKLEVSALVRGTDSNDWKRILEFSDPKGVRKSLALPMGMFAGDGTSYREMLMNMGLEIEPTRAARDTLAIYIQKCCPHKTLEAATRFGWHDRTTFVMPEKTFGNENVVYLPESTPEHALRTQGTLEEWQDSIAKHAIGNSRIIFSLSASLAAPLLTLLGEDSGGFHIRGASSTGKSTCLFAAASVWGGGGRRGYVRQWRATANGLEGVAVLHNDGLLCLDELSQASGDEVGEVIYMIMNEAGKSRAARSGAARKAFDWRVMLLSNGEVSLATKIGESGKRKSTAGQEVRFIDIVADAGTGFGIFDTLHSFKSGDEFSRHLRAASAKYYGTAIRAFLEKIFDNELVLLIDELRTTIRSFVSTLELDTPDGQVSRVANRFAVVATSGELATKLGVLPWKQGEASKAAIRIFGEWLTNRGGNGAHESRALIRQVRHFLELHGESRFSVIHNLSPGANLDVAFGRPTIQRAGYRKTISNRTEYYFLPEVFAQEVCRGFDTKFAVRVLKDHGLLVVGDGNHLQRKLTGPGMSAARYYCVSEKIFDSAPDVAPEAERGRRNGGNAGNSGNAINNLHTIGDIQFDRDRSGQRFLEGNRETSNTKQSQFTPPFAKSRTTTNPEDWRSLPHVPIIPTTITSPSALASFEFDCLNRDVVESGFGGRPAMSDMSARTINRLGGWAKFAARYKGSGRQALSNEFVHIYLELLPHKLSGHYDRDRLPSVEGASFDGDVYRLDLSDVNFGSHGSHFPDERN